MINGWSSVTYGTVSGVGMFVAVAYDGTGNRVMTSYTPTVTGVTPSSGLLAGGTSVTLTGTGFTGATGVTFGGTAGTSVVVVSATSITVTSPAHAAGAVAVVVSTPGGTATSTGGFTYAAVAAAPAAAPVLAASGFDVLPWGVGGVMTLLIGAGLLVLMRKYRRSHAA